MIFSNGVTDELKNNEQEMEMMTEMDDIKELAELISDANDYAFDICYHGKGCKLCKYQHLSYCGNYHRAEYLIAHGITLGGEKK